MHLKIKPNNHLIRSMYEQHGSYHEGDSGLDLFVPEPITIPANEISFKINLGISCEAFYDKSKQKNISYYLYLRSSTGAKTPLRLSNHVGIIDSGYRGNIIAIVDNISNEPYMIQAGNRLVQLCDPMLSCVSYQVVNRLSETPRGEGGLGSTGY